ncbi:hypothetical protein ACOMHN_010211 [Nucella lapillus]
MVLSPFASMADDTRLVRYRDTVYKLKVLVTGGSPEKDARLTATVSDGSPSVQTETDADTSFHTEMEEVVRAVMYMVENGTPLVKIETPNFLVVPSLKLWKAGEVLGFRQNEQELKVFPKVVILSVSPWQLLPESAPVVFSAASSLTGARGKGSADGVRSSEGGGEGGGDARRGESSVQQKSTAKSAESRESVAERNGDGAGIEGGVQRPSTPGRVASHTAGVSVAQSVVPEPVPLSSAASSAIRKTAEDLSINVNSASPKPSSSQAKATKNPPTQADKDSVPASHSSDVSADTGRPSTRVQRSTNISDQSPPSRTRSQTSTQTGQQKKPSQKVSVEIGSTGSYYNLRQTVRGSSQSPRRPSQVRGQDKNSSNASCPVQDKPVVGTNRGPHSRKPAPQPEKSNTSSAERRGLKSINGGKDPNQESSAKSLSPSLRRTHQPPRFVHSGGESTREREKRTKDSSLSASSELSLRSILKRQQNNPSRVHFAPSQSLSTTSAGGFEPGRPPRQYHRAPPQGLTPNMSRYDLRRTIHRSTIVEEQRLKGLTSDSRQTGDGSNPPRPPTDPRQTGGDYPPPGPTPPPPRSTLPHSRQTEDGSRPAPRTFEQKDRHVVETGDIQEELKLQALANAHNLDRGDNSSPPRGTKRRGSLLQSFADGFVAPLKRALRAYRDAV